MIAFKGIWTALWTPTDQEGKLIKPALKHHLEFLRQAGVHGIVVGGSTGEFIRLPLKIRQELLDCVMQYSGELPLILNISHPVFNYVKELAKQARDSKIAGIMVLPPSYYPISQQDIAAYFMEVYSFTRDLPLILYNFPECVRNTIEMEALQEITDRIPIAGIKQSGSNFEYHVDLVKLGRKKGFSVLTGSDTRLPEVVRMGVNGSIGGTSNGIPELIVESLSKSLQNQDTTEVQSKIQEIVKVMSQLPYPYNIAALMQARGLDVGSPKIPQSSQSKHLQEKVVKELESLDMQFVL